MSASFAQLLLPRLHFHASRIGWPGACGIALLVFGMTLALSGVRDAEQQLGRVQAEIDGLRAARIAPQADAAQSARALWRSRLPARAEAPRLLASLQQAAASHGLALDSADYQVQRDGTLLRYQVTLPMRGSYPQLRAWLAQVMNATPALALDEFTLVRESAGSQTLDARVRVALLCEER
jgi:Tfp pilus assembly protein PilO